MPSTAETVAGFDRRLVVVVQPRAPPGASSLTVQLRLILSPLLAEKSGPRFKFQQRGNNEI